MEEHDHLFILGDIFDRSSSAPDPFGVYFNILKLEDKCTMIRGNHDQWLAEYIINYYRVSETKRARLAPYPYNTFELLMQRLTPVDMQNLANWILSWPVQVELKLEDVKYLLAHAITSSLGDQKSEDYYLTGEKVDDKFLQQGIIGYISICGHTNLGGNYIWKNALKNVYVCDCGCGYTSGRLGCLCLETKEEFLCVSLVTEKEDK